MLTPEQEVSLIDFAQNDKVYRKYVDELIILLGTGLRISEFCGLTTNLDFKESPDPGGSPAFAGP